MHLNIYNVKDTGNQKLLYFNFMEWRCIKTKSLCSWSKEQWHCEDCHINHNCEVFNAYKKGKNHLAEAIFKVITFTEEEMGKIKELLKEGYHYEKNDMQK